MIIMIMLMMMMVIMMMMMMIIMIMMIMMIMILIMLLIIMMMIMIPIMMMMLMMIIMMMSMRKVAPSLFLAGVGIYDNACLINHSCVPNSVAIFEGSKIQIRAIKEIAIDEEISISYIETLETIDSKQKELRQRYFFQCSCTLCSKDEGTDSWQKGKCQNGSCGKAVLPTEKGIYTTI